MTTPAMPSSSVNPLDPIYGANFSDHEDENEANRAKAEETYFSKVISQKIRDEWIRDQLKQRKEEFTDYHDLRVFIGTWNVNGKKPLESIDAWLGSPEGPPDLYVIGFQEVVDLTASNVMMDSASRERAQVWVDTIGATLTKLHQGRRYHVVAERHLVGVLLVIFVLDRHMHKVPQISIQSTVTPTGVMGMGNKGGVSVRLQMYDTTFCFVCAHLAAHREAVDARNADYRNIMQKTTFRDDAQSMSQRSAEERLSAPADATMLLPDGQRVYRNANMGLDPTLSGGVDGFNGGNGTGNGVGRVNPGGSNDDDETSSTSFGSLDLSPVLANSTFSIADHDYVFWLGDFNYRIQADHSIDEVFRRVGSKDLAWLRANDQLLIEQANGRTFVGFKEAEIQFLPTYKFQTGTNFYDRRPEKKVRAPAFCDRILWRDIHDGNARILKYSSCTSLCTSDHKPVVGIFSTRVKERIPERRSVVFQEIIRQLDRFENDERPQISLDRHAIAFPGPGLMYMEKREETINLTNIGRVPVTWRFVPKLEDLTICKPWLKVEPDFGLLTPGATAQIRITAQIDAPSARRLSTGVDVLDDILVLRLERGRDHFICISANLIPTCFGVSLSKLVRTQHPFASTQEERDRILSERIGKFGSDRAKAPLRLPKELWWLCNFLWIYELFKVPKIFEQSSRLSTPEQLAKVRYCIDNGVELVPDDKVNVMAHAVAAVMIEFLTALPDPVVPFSLFPRGELDNISMDTWGRRFLDQLPPLSHNVFVYIISFLREVIKHGTYNRVAPRRLAAIFAQCLMRPADLAERQKETSAQSNIPFELPQWFTGEKKESTLSQLAEKVILHFIDLDKPFMS